MVLLLSTLTSLTQLFSLTMDVHSRLRTESHQDVTGERAVHIDMCHLYDILGTTCFSSMDLPLHMSKA